MKNNTLYASEYTYGFEEARIDGIQTKNIIEGAERLGKFKINPSLEYLDDFYDKDTGEVILACIVRNLKSNI